LRKNVAAFIDGQTSIDDQRNDQTSAAVDVGGNMRLSCCAPRRAIFVLALIAFAGGLAPVAATAADFPSRVVRLIVPFAPGASTDLVARLLGQKLSVEWGQPVIVENRGGAGGGIGADMVAKADPDGYTLLLTNQGPHVLNALLRKDAPYTVDDLAPIIEIGSTPLIIVANPKFPPNDVKELVDYAKAHPGKVHIGTSGTNSNVHIGLEILKSATGTDMVHVPYRGTGPSLNDAVAGTIEGAYTTTVSAIGLVEAGRLKVLGVAAPKRSDVIPKVTTYKEQGITGADTDLWIGLVAPAKTPKAIIDKVNHDVNKALQDAEVRRRFAEWGLDAQGGTPDAFGKVIKSEADRIRALVAANKLQVE
jgi:tripartite-type tricarboxylate transporter receptor subunit TctC